MKFFLEAKILSCLNYEYSKVILNFLLTNKNNTKEE